MIDPFSDLDRDGLTTSKCEPIFGIGAMRAAPSIAFAMVVVNSNDGGVIR